MAQPISTDEKYIAFAQTSKINSVNFISLIF